MFKTRLISGIILVLIILALGINGGEVLLAGLGIISIIGLRELYCVFKLEKSLMGHVGYIAVVLFYFFLKMFPLTGNGMFVFSMLLLIILMTGYVLTFPKYKAEQVMAAFFGVFYVAVMLSCIYLTRMLPNGVYLIWLIFLCSWGCDTCAYCVGMLFGKHKMAPVLSPKKSIEGAIGGIVGTAILTIIYGFIFQSAMNISNIYILIMAAISVAGAFISMIGDLAASAVKRNYDIKDYGTLIPGHGGILDRFDSVIFTAPIIYFLALYLI